MGSNCSVGSSIYALFLVLLVHRLPLWPCLKPLKPKMMHYAMSEITEPRTTMAKKLQILGFIFAMNNLFMVRRLLSLPNGMGGTVGRNVSGSWIVDPRYHETKMPSMLVARDL